MAASDSRLLVRLVQANPPGVYGRVRNALLVRGDEFMMHKQLRVLKECAERADETSAQVA